MRKNAEKIDVNFRRTGTLSVYGSYDSLRFAYVSLFKEINLAPSLLARRTASFVLILRNIRCNFRDSGIHIIIIRDVEKVHCAASPRFRDFCLKRRDFETGLIFSETHHFLWTILYP